MIRPFSILKHIRFIAICSLLFIKAPLGVVAEDQNGAQAESKPQPQLPPGRKPAQVMGFLGAAWLERSDRDQEERPDLVIQAMELKETDVVADIGCGTGYFTRRIAPLVPKGTVYGVDIQPEMITELKKYLAKDGLTNVEPIVNKEDDPMLPKGTIDWMLLVDVYHEFQNPAPMLAKMLESLSPNGKVALVEFRLEDDTAKHIKKEHRMTVKQVLSEWNPAGFELVDLIETLPTQHLFIFHRRPDYTAKSAASVDAKKFLEELAK